MQLPTPLARVLSRREDDPYLPGAAAAGILPRHYDLDLHVRLSNNRLTGTATITGEAQRDTDTFVLDLVGLQASKATVNGQAAKVKQGRSSITITAPRTVPEGEEIVLTVKYDGAPRPRRGLWGEVGWEELTDGVLVAGQPNGAPTWFPCVDHPAYKATFDISCWTDAGYRAIANGALESTARKGSQHRWVYHEAFPTSTYLAALQIGRYDVVEHTGRVGFAASNALTRRARTALKDQEAMFALFERCFGPYPFECYTSVVCEESLEIPLEAMEMSLFGINHMTAAWENQRLIAHEMSHQWWGNSVTLRQWRDLWIHEGFACYSEWLWSEESGRSTVEAEARLAYAGLAAKPQDLVLADPGAEDMFDDRVYKRGALTVHALRVRLGDERFFAALRAVQAAFRHAVASTDDVLAVLMEATGDDELRTVLSPWLLEPALPPFPVRAA
ncbi:M1 family metallopeptidase [Falsarthrobacter nasiphocae]|uniref:Aminopeptidase N n=1 Tax=Falsarthrobacter nasiphocae TaxID=189863 RepID=A0AAE4C6Z9_9MICC|nr:M1 family metallopeptidase [Falsarthrobacter nasiphocae]MDR6892702.1 aminopeptidase N [Falsarthrobacter nasiphocae]